VPRVRESICGNPKSCRDEVPSGKFSPDQESSPLRPHPSPWASSWSSLFLDIQPQR